MAPNPSRDIEEADDRILASLIASRDEAALAECFRRHGGSVVALARRILRDQGHAEEVAQGVFLRLWEKPEAFDAERGSLRSYLLAMAHGRSIDLIRSEEARRRREENDHHRTAPLGTPAAQEAWLAVLRGEVRDAVRGLPDGERAAIILAYFGGYTYQQTAEELGLPEGTVKSRIRAGLARLATMITAGEGPA